MSEFYIGITDSRWISLLREDYNKGLLPKKINFWTPGTREFKAIKQGELFLFKRHNSKVTGEKGEIVGGAYFSHYEKMTVSAAWDKYGRGNGYESLDSMRNASTNMQNKVLEKTSVEIGCVILEKPFFLDRLIDEPSDWRKTIVSGKKYYSDTKIGSEIYKLIIDGNKKKLVNPLEDTYSAEEQRQQAVDIKLCPLLEEDKNQFILDNQETFRYGALEEFGLRDAHFEEDGEIISRATIENSISEGIAYRIVHNNRNVGGLVVKVEGNRGELELLFVSPRAHSKGIGYAAWCAVETMYPQVKVWETSTPYFEKRNIHFYVNRCGFHIVEFFNQKHPDPHYSEAEQDEDFVGMFRFEKEMKKN